MKKILLIIPFLLLFNGCSVRDRYIVEKQKCIYPTLNIKKNFKKSKKYKLQIWVEEDNNGTEFIVGKKNDILGLIKNTKKLRNNYNLLLENIINFNTKLNDLKKKE